MSVCAAQKKDGKPCSLVSRDDSEYCWAHSPEHAQQRSQNAAKAGRAKGPAGELADLRALIKRYMDDVEKGRLEKGKGSVLAQLAGVAGRLYEIERKVRETEELADEVAELKRIINNGRGGSWAG